ncbi:MAG: hypothetical protein HYX65_10605 [Gemmatimonadetes bacterium]|nr:hypothetical protein [Gemmatimonadota bacterium]
MRRASIVLAALIASAACGKKEEPPKPALAFKVQSVDLGKSIGANKRIMKPATTFGPRDTIYVVVNSVGVSSSVTMQATWKDAKGTTISDYSQTVAPNGAAATEFHVSHTRGWPVGKYSVIVTANGSAAGTRAFDVKK